MGDLETEVIHAPFGQLGGTWCDPEGPPYVKPDLKMNRARRFCELCWKNQHNTLTQQIGLEHAPD